MYDAVAYVHMRLNKDSAWCVRYFSAESAAFFCFSLASPGDEKVGSTRALDAYGARYAKSLGLAET